MTQLEEMAGSVALDDPEFWRWLQKTRKKGYKIYKSIRGETGSVRLAAIAYYGYMHAKVETYRRGDEEWDIPIDGSTPLEVMYDSGSV